MDQQFSRRRFLELSAKGIGLAVISSGLMSCDVDDLTAGDFLHGVASGDPITDAVILWTRITPKADGQARVIWEVAKDKAFTDIIHRGSTVTDLRHDYTIKIDAVNLEAATIYYYRFRSKTSTSVIGKTKTLPSGSVDSVKFAVLSCANYPAGYFNVYALVAQQTDLDAIIHLGDYIYEYGRDGYASQNAAAMGREVLPQGEILTLQDYRTRYAQYRTDTNLQALHVTAPFIAVWDDHEVANNTWREGAENHNVGEGDFVTRKLAALQAYFEWMPIRPMQADNLQDSQEIIYRRFKFGDLVDLFMLDTRVIARDRQLSYNNYFATTTNSFDSSSYDKDLHAQGRTMLGSEQLNWLMDGLAASTATWQILGQQVLMGTMQLPGALVTRKLDLDTFTLLDKLASLSNRAAAGDTTLTKDQLAYLQANQVKLTPENMALLQLPKLPLNLDAWDGYPNERQTILNAVKQFGGNLVVLAGDTHNAWANHLRDSAGNIVAVELATPSVSSPGLGDYLEIKPDRIAATEKTITGFIPDLQYTNWSDRGYLLLEFTANQTNATWHYVNTVTTKTFAENTARRFAMQTSINQPGLITVNQANYNTPPK